MLRPFRTLAVVAIVTFAGNSISWAGLSDMASLLPDEDTFSREQLPTATYGTAGALHVSGATATNGSGVVQGVADSWLKFDTTLTIAQFDTTFGAGNWTLQSAVLSVREVATPPNAVFTRGVGDFGVSWIADDNWSQGSGAPAGPGTATGNQLGWAHGQSLLSASDRALGVFQNAGSNLRQDFSLALDVDFVADLLSGGPTTLRMAAASDGIGFTVNSANNGNVNNRPRLVLTAIPEPSTAILLLAAGFIIRRRR